MNIQVSSGVALVRGAKVLITDVQSALDLIATVNSETNCAAMVISKEAMCGDFWRLSSCLAGEVLQKFINYQMKLAIVGDFTALTEGSKSLHDFIYESNRGKNIFFVNSEAEALKRLGAWLAGGIAG